MVKALTGKGIHSVPTLQKRLACCCLRPRTPPRHHLRDMGSISSRRPDHSDRSVAARAATVDRLEDLKVTDPQCSRGFTYTSYEANAWQAKFAKSGVTILVDPWLVGELVFYGQEWAFRGKKGSLPPVDVDALAAKTDLIILTQGLPDHAHKPTLERLPKEKPVVCSPAAARVASEMGFKNIYELDHGRAMDFADGRLNIRATIGALVGPPWSRRENGFIFTETSPQGISLYYEPHCDYQEKSFEVDSVDAVITPAVDQVLGAYPLVTGARNIVQLLRRLKPKVVLPLINAGFPSEGPLAKVVREEGDVNTLASRLQAEGIQCEVKMPAPAGQSIEIAL